MKSIFVKAKLLKMMVLFFCFTTFHTMVKAQVTIGSGVPPVRAALLDMKDKKPEALNITSESGGIVLPRVWLNKMNTLAPFIPESDAEWLDLNKQAQLKKQHVGLIVYNLNPTAGLHGRGIYLWDGQTWQRLNDTGHVAGSEAWLKQGNNETNPNTDFIGTSDLKDLSIRTNKVERIRIKALGDIYLAGKLPISPSNQVYPLAVDANGRVSVIRGEDDNSKPFNYVKYEIEIGEGNSGGDWINNFNTGVNTTKYTVVIVGSSFITRDSKGNLDPTQSLLKSNSNADGATYNASAVYAEAKNGKWILKADHISGGTANGKPGKWDIHCLIINNSMVNILKPIKGKVVGGTGVGGVASPLNGL